MAGGFLSALKRSGVGTDRSGAVETCVPGYGGVNELVGRIAGSPLPHAGSSTYGLNATCPNA